MMTIRISEGALADLDDGYWFYELQESGLGDYFAITLSSDIEGLKVAELLKEASKVDLSDRAELVSSLLEDLDPQPHHVSDEEVFERLEELKSGKVQGLSKEEF
jgi:hypothetical protein